LILNKYDSTTGGGSSGGYTGDSSGDVKKPVKVVLTGGCGNIA